MTDQSKKENGQEKDTALSPDNVVSVDFGGSGQETKYVAKQDIMAPPGDAAVQVYLVEETKIIGLHFSRPVEDFRLDLAGADQFISALVQAFMKLKEDKSS